MTKAVGRGGQRSAPAPSNDDVLLLRAALADGDAARQAWLRLHSRFDVDRATGERYRLLPLLGWNLERVGFGPDDEPRLTRLLGLTRRTWVQAQRHEAAAAAATDVVASAGIDGLVFKGVALARAAYPALGLRPMEDVDLLVLPDRSSACLDALLDAGYRRRPEPVSLHAAAVVDPAGHEIDVHAHASVLLVRERAHAAIEQLWHRHVALVGTTMRTLDPADHLLVVLEHAMGSPSSAPLRWIADATGLTRQQRIDWAYFVEQVDRFGNAYSVGLALDILDRVGTASLPRWVHAEIHALHPRLNDRVLVRLGWDHRFPSAARSLLLRLNAEDPADRLRRLPTLVIETLDTGSLDALPRTAVRRSHSYVRRRVAR